MRDFTEALSALRESISPARTWCIACDATAIRPVFAIERKGIPPGEDGHSIVYRHAVLVCCADCGAGHIEVLDHDCFDFEEVWDQFEWYTLAPADCAEVVRALARCPQPLLPACTCALHQAVRESLKPLPRRPWRTGLEAEAHVHRVSLVWRGGRLGFEFQIKQENVEV